MKIIHKNKVIAKGRFCETFLSRNKGLMFSKKLKKEEAIILVANKEGIMETTIHMLFVFFSIDAVWINKSMRVVDIRRNVKPFSLWIKPKEKARYLIEMGVNSTNYLKIGDLK